jgi:two-component system, NtrC family, sensor kinase
MIAKERAKFHKLMKVMALIAVLLLAGTGYLGFSTVRQMKTILREQFNAEQLVLARATAQRIEFNIQAAIADLVLLNSLPAVQYCDPDSYETLLLSTLPVLNRDNLVEIRRVDRNGHALFVANDQGIAMRHLSLAQSDASAYLSWASDLNNRGKTMGTSLRSKDPAFEKRQLVMDLIIPTYEEAGNSLHPQPSHGFTGYLKATLDVSRLLSQIVPSIRSGKSGYAWVLDSSGIFLYHPENSFIGENAFEIRSSRDPRISFAQINEIQRNEMMKGKEGSGDYLSGWHRDVVEPMEKLIAYAPVRIQGPYLDYVWSVAVVAPADEVEGIITSIYGRQVFLEGLVLLLIFLAAIVAMLHQWRWSNVLEEEVAAKIDDLNWYARELETSGARFRALAENAEDLVFTLDGEGIVKTMNQYMSGLFGVSTDELAGQSLYCLLPFDQSEEQLKLVNQALRSRLRLNTETAFRIHDQDFWFNLQYIPVRDEGSGEDYVLAIGRDVTERKSLERQLINTEKLASLGTLAAGVAHEINNPLGIMMGFCDLLLEKIEPGTMEYNDLKTIERHGLHCKSIIERLLSFARISEETETESDLNATVEAILAVVKHTLTMNHIRLVSSFTESLPLLRIDSKGLQQVLLNLISNAIHAIDGQGMLRVKTQWGKEPGWLEVVVSDTGSGIEKEFLPRIFDPFFTTKKVGEGTGLGLSVSYGIVSQYGGTIECESYTQAERPGNSGTIFTIRLPVKIGR